MTNTLAAGAVAAALAATAAAALSGCASEDTATGTASASSTAPAASSVPATADSLARPPHSINSPSSGSITMTVHITTGDQVVTAELDDTPAAESFAAMLPLKVTLSDFHGIEKVADLPDPIATQNAPAGYQASAGDLAYYTPWGNLAIFYRDFEYATGLVRLGQITSNTDVLSDLAGPVTISVAGS